MEGMVVTSRPTAEIAAAVSGVAYSRSPSARNFSASASASVRSCSSTLSRTPLSFPGVGADGDSPAAVRPLNSASFSVRPIPSTSPVDFISGPR